MIKHILAATSAPGIGGGALKASAQASTTAAVVIQTYVGNILKQPDLALPDVLPNLPEHQKTARDHAVNWRDNVQPQMIKTNTDIVAFANAFDSYYDPLMQLAAKITQNPGDTKSIGTFSIGVGQLHGLVANKQTSATDVVSSLGDFQTKLAADARNFGSDFSIAEAKLAGKDGEIAAIGKQIDGIHSAMQKDLDMIAGGSTAAVVGGLMVAVGALAEIETAGVSTALIVGGLAVVGTGAGLAIAGGVDYAKQTSALGAALSLQSTLQQQYSATKQVNSTVQGLSKQSSAAVTAVGALLDGWQTLAQNFVEFQDALTSATPDLGYFLTAQLQAAKADWDDVAQMANKLLDYGSLSVQDVPPGRDGTLTPDAETTLAALAA